MANYTFSMDNDDGAMLYIDGHALVNHTGAHRGCPQAFKLTADITTL